MRLQVTRFMTIIGLAMLAAACGDSTTGTGGGTTTFEGVVAGDSASGLLSGKLTLTIETASLSVAPVPAFDMTGTAVSVNVTGTFTPVGGSATTLTGTYDDATKKLSVSGGGFSFDGTFSNGGITGTFTNASGGGGSFSTSSKSGTAPIYSFCGNAEQTSSNTGGGGGATFNLTINTGSGVASGLAIGKGDHTAHQLTGTASGSSWSISFTNGEGSPGSASGTFTSTSLTGTYSIPADQETGTVSGSICQ